MLDILFGMRWTIALIFLLLLMDCEVSLKRQAQGSRFTWSYMTFAFLLLSDNIRKWWQTFGCIECSNTPKCNPLGPFAVPNERKNLNGGAFDSHAELSSPLKAENPLFGQGKFLPWWCKLYVSSDHVILSRRLLSFQLYLLLCYYFEFYILDFTSTETADIGGNRGMDCNWGSLVFMNHLLSSKGKEKNNILGIALHSHRRQKKLSSPSPNHELLYQWNFSVKFLKSIGQWDMDIKNWSPCWKLEE